MEGLRWVFKALVGIRGLRWVQMDWDGCRGDSGTDPDGLGWIVVRGGVRRGERLDDNSVT